MKQAQGANSKRHGALLLWLSLLLIGLLWLMLFSDGRGRERVGGDTPVSFVARSPGAFRTLPITHVQQVTSDEGPSNGSWPFSRRTVLIACASPSFNIVKVGADYAALNGHTSGWRDRYVVSQEDGSRHQIVGTSNNQALRDAGIVRPEAEDLAIGQWWGALNGHLSSKCP